MANDAKLKKFKKELDELKSNLQVQEEKLEKTLEELEEKNEKLTDLEDDLEKKNDESEEYLSHLQRLQADFENFKKQTEKRNQDIIKFANENMIINFLDSYEDLERVLKKSKTEKELREGVELIYSKIKNTLEKEGLDEIPTDGEKFDPFKHEALMAEASEDHENGEIIEELMKGYTLKDKVIKYSKVKVCKK
ncbi:MAG: nucleotide exchange factor GrpE [Methanobrevibacter sp.]|nr:nucleotide exchange factor GrpE [Methanobrevibacter sp.]